jgi:hypothetical protein
MGDITVRFRVGNSYRANNSNFYTHHITMGRDYPLVAIGERDGTPGLIFDNDNMEEVEISHLYFDGDIIKTRENAFKRGLQ